MTRTYAYLAMFIMVVLALVGIYFAGDRHGRNAEQLKCNDDINHAILATRADERKTQMEINDALQKYADTVARDNVALVTQLDQLRTRANRLSEAARAGCKGASGAELSRQDAEFLAREAARADIQRTALALCYDYADSIASK